MTLNINWIILTLLAATCWGAVNVYDKRLLNDSIITISTRQFLDSLISILIAIFLLVQLSTPTLDLIFIGLSAGSLVYFYNYLYYRSLLKADVSAAASYMQTIPIFSAAIGYFFFSETFPFSIYICALLIILGAIFVTIERNEQGDLTIFSSKNLAILCKLLLPASIIMSSSYGLSKNLLFQYSFWDVYFWGRIGFSLMTFFCSVISNHSRQEISFGLKSITLETAYKVTCIELLNFLGLFFLIAAYAIGTITLVTTSTAIQPLIVVIIAVSSSILKGEAPLKDFTSSRTVFVIRIIAILIQIVGISILYNY